MHLIWALIVGLVVGAIAKLLMPGRDPGGIFITMLISTPIIISPSQNDMISLKTVMILELIQKKIAWLFHAKNDRIKKNEKKK